MAETVPSNKGKAWTDEESAKLIEELQTEATYDAIATAHGRTSGAITSQALKIAEKLLADSSNTVESINKKTRVTLARLTKLKESGSSSPEMVETPAKVVEKIPFMPKTDNELLNEIRDLLREVLITLKEKK